MSGNWLQAAAVPREKGLRSNIGKEECYYSGN